MATVEVKETTGCTTVLAVEVEPERVDDQVNATLRRMKQQVQIPGFRKGKAPESMIMKRFGGLVREEAVKDVIPAVLQEVFAEKDITPVGEPQISDFVFGDDGPMTFTVAVEQMPVLSVDGFEGLAVTKEVVAVTDADVDNYLDRLRQSKAEQVDVDRPAQKNDLLVVNLQKLDSSGVPVIGDKMEGHMIALDGQGTPSPEFDEQVIGMSAGDSKTVRFTYDDSIGNKELVGTEEAYEVEVVKVVENRLPELDDAFAKDMGEFSSLDEFREKTRESLAAHNDMMAERKLQETMITEFVKAYPFDVPQSMVERVIASEMENARRYYQGQEFDEQGFRDRMQADAVRAVQNYVIGEAVKEQKQIEVTKEEIDDRLEKLASMNDQSARDVRRELIKSGRFESFRNDIAQEMVYTWMKEAVAITEETIDPASESNIVTP